MIIVLSVAAVEVIIYGRFWVITEGRIAVGSSHDELYIRSEDRLTGP